MSNASIAFFENLMSPKKEVRENAEKELEKLKSAPIKESIEIFSTAMSSSNESIFQLSTLMLKKIYLDNKETKMKLTPEEIGALITLLKSKINFTSLSWKSLQRIAEALAPCYMLNSLPNGLSEIMAWFNDGSNAQSRKFAIFLIEVLCDLEAIKDEHLDDGACENFKEIFSKGLGDSDVDVKVSSLKAATQFLNSLQSENIIMKFTALCDKMIATLVDALKHDNESKDASSSGKTALETMNYIIDSHPKFWKDKCEQIIDIVFQIAKGKIFSNTIRESALELVYSLAKNVPGVIKKSNNFKNVFIPMMFELLLEVDHIDKVEEWEKQVEENEVDLDDIYYGVRDGFERLSLDLGGKFFSEATAGFIKKYLTSQNWVEVHAGFTAMAFMSEGCKESYKANLLDLLNFISTGLTHTHPRVRYAGLLAFGSLLKDTAPKPQKQYTNNILPALASLMSAKEPSIRVKTQSCNCVVEYLKGLLGDNKSSSIDGNEILKPYSADLVKLLSDLFENSLTIGYAPLQEATLNAISCLSNLLEKNFAPYYEIIMPGLKKLFYNLDAKTNEQKTLKSNCIETIAFLCSSVSENAEKYMNDLTEISQAFANYMNTLEEEDPQLGTILNAYSHLSMSMKEKFIPILNNLVPLLTKYIKADIGVKVEDAQLTEYIPEDENEEQGKVDSVVLSIGTKSAKLSLHTFALQNKILAFHSFNEIALNMGASFFPFTETLLQLCKELIQFPYSRKIRKLAIKAVYSCITCCKEEAQKEKIMTFMGEDIIKGFAHNIKSQYLRETKAYLKYLTLITSEVNDPKCFTENFVSKIYECLNQISKFIDAKKQEILTKVMNSKDEDDEEPLREDFDHLSEVSRRLMELSGNFFRIYKEPLTALVTKSLYDSFLGHWQSDVARTKFNSSQEILSAICFFCDFMEYSELVAFNMFYPIFIDLTSKYKDTNEDIIQSIVYGYGIICKRISREDFAKVKEQVATMIVNLIQRPVNEENELTFDNAIGALGKMVYYQLNNDETGNKMALTFVKLLPLKNDLEEGKEVCKELFMQIAKENPIIVNQNCLNELKEAVKRIRELNESEKFLEEVEVNLRETCTKIGI